MLAPILIGFVMATIGVAMLCIGEVPFVSGRRIPALRSRLIGGVLVGFLPLAFAVHRVISLAFGSDWADGPTVTWSIFSVCWIAVTSILFRVLVPKQEPRRPVPQATDTMSFTEPEPAPPLEDPPPISMPAAAPPAKKAPGKKPAPQAESDPFDFS